MVLGMSAALRWTPGDAIVLRGIWRHSIWFACPVVVTVDSPDLIALYWRAGTGVKIPGRRCTPKDFLSMEQVYLIDSTWVETDVLALTVPGAAHSVYAMWEAGHASFRCWYVNLQEPLRRTSMGFDTMDHLLDVVVSPDRSEWQWKDEDEFGEAVALGLYSSEEARAIRAEGERALTLLQAKRPPFGDVWRRWLPPEEWAIPSLQAGWDDMGIGDDAIK